MQTTELKEVNMLNDALFKALFRSVEAREMVVDFLSELIGIKKEVLEQADYQGGEIPKKIMTERNKTADMIIKIEDSNRIILEMNQYLSQKMNERNTSYAFSIASETIISGSKKYPKVILVNFDNFNYYKTERGILNFKLRDEEGHIETEQYHSIHLVLENIIDKKYNKRDEIKKMVKLLRCKTVEEMEEKFKGDENYMSAIRKVSELSTDPNFVGYYDIEEAHRQQLEDMEETGYEKGMEEGKSIGLKEGKSIGLEEGKIENQKEVARAMYQKKIPLDVISECTGLSIEEVQGLLNVK